MKGSRLPAIALVALVLSAGAAGQALADEKSAIKYRQSVMKAMGGHMGAMGQILRGAGKPGDFRIHADAVAALAKIVPHVFPEGSDFGETDAKPGIWEKPEEFARALEALGPKARALAAAAGKGAPMAATGDFAALGRICGDCHKKFRVKHEH